MEAHGHVLSLNLVRYKTRKELQDVLELHTFEALADIAPVPGRSCESRASLHAIMCDASVSPASELYASGCDSVSHCELGLIRHRSHITLRTTPLSALYRL